MAELPLSALLSKPLVLARLRKTHLIRAPLDNATPFGRAFTCAANSRPAIIEAAEAEDASLQSAGRAGCVAPGSLLTRRLVVFEVRRLLARAHAKGIFDADPDDATHDLPLILLGERRRVGDSLKSLPIE